MLTDIKQVVRGTKSGCESLFVKQARANTVYHSPCAMHYGKKITRVTRWPKSKQEIDSSKRWVRIPIPAKDLYSEKSVKIHLYYHLAGEFVH